MLGKDAFVGYSTGSTYVSIYRPEEMKVHESRNVIVVKTPSVAPILDLVLDEGAFAYDESDGLVRDVRDYAIRLELGASSEHRRPMTFRCFTSLTNFAT